MKSRIVLALISLLPLLFGFITNHLATTVWFYTFPSGWYWFMGIFFLLLWFVAGWASAKWVNSSKEALIYLNAVAGLVLILILYQEFIMGRYWWGWLGASTQFYYMTLAHIPNRLFRIIPVATIRFSYICIVAFCIQLLASFLGRKIGERS